MASRLVTAVAGPLLLRSRSRILEVVVVIVWNELRYAARVLSAAPGFAAVAIATLALAIGANTAIFSVINGLLIQPLPFPAADRLVVVSYRYPHGNPPLITVSQFVHWRAHNRVFTGIAVRGSEASGMNLTGGGPPERLQGFLVSREFFSVYGVRPALGRDFLPAEDRPGAPGVVVLSHALWSRRFGADPAILGRRITLNGQGHTVIGVMPPTFRVPEAADLWAPLRLDPASNDRVAFLEAVGRLREGVDLSPARTEMAEVGRRWAAASLEMATVGAVELTPLAEHLYGEIEPVLRVLLGAVAMVLLIACVNLANLQLARATSRRREIAIRSAMGAGPLQIARQMLVESVLLALAGGAAGLLVAYGSLRPLLALRPEGIELLAPITIDAAVLAFTFGLSVATGLLFGLAPAFQSTRALHEPLRTDSTRTTGGTGWARVRRLLVVSEVALAQVLLTAALLLARSLVGLLGAGPGFDTESVLTMRLSPSESEYGEVAALDRFTRQVVARVAALSGVETAAVIVPLPVGFGGETAAELPFTIEGRWDGRMDADAPGVGSMEYRASTPAFFGTLGVPLVAGRLFTPADGPGAPRVAIVNETAARWYWVGESPVGQRITVGMPIAPELADPEPRTIVGVVGDLKERGLDRPIPPIVYVPLGQVPQNLATLLVRILPIHLVVRTAGDPVELAGAVRDEIWAVDPRQPVTDVRPMEEIVRGSLAGRRSTALLLGFLALLAVLLAAIGIYGVISYLVGQRSREIGIRMAVGATGQRVLRLVIRQGLPAVLSGVAFGLAGSIAVTRLFLTDLLPGGGPADPTGFVVAPALLAAVALLATAIPADRVSRVEPMAALGRE